MAKLDRFQPPTFAEEMAEQRQQLQDEYGDIIMDDEDVFNAEIGELREKVIALMMLLYRQGEEHKGIKKAYVKALDTKDLALAQLAEEKRQLRLEIERLHKNGSTHSKNAA